MIFDFIWVAGEVLSVIGLLCGAYVSITCADHDRLSSPVRAPADTGARHDPKTANDWNATSRRHVNRLQVH